MPKPVETAADAIVVPTPPQTFDLTLEEFCARLSGSDRSVEMIAGFYSDERAKGVDKDTSENFTERYAAFATRPA
ncbi:hypothetical protein [Phenylobacterium ferrooxidans]|uniref:Uncharacterized protein n=1 Tax=Phenylobacterium ferrooxidans TaxID=2982689 RepID=A0ABW6CN98_9CAUL